MTGKIEHVDDMPVYGLFHDLAVAVERQSRSFGPDFRWLRIQALRSSESCIANLREGFYAQYSTEYLQSLFRTKREARETVTHLKYAVDVDQMPPVVVNELLPRYEDALRQLGALIKSIERKIKERGKAKPGAPKVREESPPYNVDFPPEH